MLPRLIGSEIYRGSTYGPKHPLAIPRVSTTLDLIRALGWVTPAHDIDSPRATPAELTRFHDADYVAALQRAEATQTISAEDKARFGIGANGNPIYREVFRRPATGAGGTTLAARLSAAEGGRFHVPGGGTHHGLRDRASGFCYLNDAVLGLLAWRDAGFERILYLDIDAHHGDGVESAFLDDPRVTTLSVHERDRWPFTGQASQPGALNIPVPEGFNDSEMRAVLHGAILPLIEALQPQAIMLQCGADALEEDPLARLALSNNAHREVIRAVRNAAPRFILLGGGGYNPWTVARCWTLGWATLNGIVPPERLPPAAEAVLRGLTWSRAAGRNPPEHWFATLLDAPREGLVRPAILDAVAAARGALPDTIRAVA
ncbi:MAG: acetoin utilization protein AcuC [Acetobacteraceae bacterium]|nr:acetoin utilization protein AcuC [Acetobacteraceae bacterium]